MGKNSAFSLGWGELEKLGNFKCKWKQASLNEPEEFMLVDVDGFSLRCVLGGWVGVWLMTQTCQEALGW